MNGPPNRCRRFRGWEAFRGFPLQGQFDEGAVETGVLQRLCCPSSGSSRGPRAGESVVLHEEKHRRAEAGALESPARARRKLVPFLVSCLAVGALASTGVLVGMSAGTAGASGGQLCPGSSATKCFGLTVTPRTVTHGSAATFTFAVKDDSGNKALGSAKINAPSGFTITGASASVGRVSTAGFPSTSALFLTLGLAPTGSATLTVRATVPCSGSGYKWGIQVKQSNTFKGTGNTYVIAKATAGQLTGTFNAKPGGCVLAFVPGHEPNSTTPNSPILSTFDSKGAPVEIELLTPTGVLVTTFSGSVKLVLGSKTTAGAHLSGGTSVTAAASHGIASFSSLEVNVPGTYKLLATSTGVGTTPPATTQYSTPFTIYNENLKPCASKTCSTTGTRTKGKVSVAESTNAAPTGGFLALGFGASFHCTGTPLTAKYSAVIGVLDATGKPTPQTATGDKWRVHFQITKSILKSTGLTGASQWQICYAAVTLDFTDLTGAAAPTQMFHTTVTNKTVTAYVGLLPSCSGTVGPPCVATRHKDGAGNEVITVEVAGDNYIR